MLGPHPLDDGRQNSARGLAGVRLRELEKSNLLDVRLGRARHNVPVSPVLRPSCQASKKAFRSNAALAALKDLLTDYDDDDASYESQKALSQNTIPWLCKDHRTTRVATLEAAVVPAATAAVDLLSLSLVS